MSLSVFVGPMFSGKTSSVIRELTNIADTTESKIIFITHVNDNRDTENIISSHASSYKGLSHKITPIKTNFLRDVDVSEIDIIGCDEGQIYPDLYETILSWVNLGKHIYCAALDGSWKMSKFNIESDMLSDVSELLPISNSFTKLNAVCKECIRERGISFCLSELPKASFTCKIGGNTDIFQIGGAEKYIPVCRFHHAKIMKIKILT